MRTFRVYRHFKGNLYLVIGVAEHTETGECLVFYLDCKAAEEGNIKLWTRPYTMFTDEVTIAGKRMKRFRLLPWSQVPEEYRRWQDKEECRRLP